MRRHAPQDKTEGIRHYAEHLHSALTNVAAQTDKDLDVDVLSSPAL